MNIRFTHPDDVPAITVMLNDEIVNGVAHFGTEPIDEAEIRKQLQDAGDRFPWYTAADDNGRFLGFCKAGAWSPRGGYNWTAEITIYIMKHAQGRGVGKALYTRLLDTLRAQRFQIIVAGISEPNPASVGLHTSIGMEQTGYNATMGYKHGRWIDVSYYQMVLGDLADPPPPVLTISEAIGDRDNG